MASFLNADLPSDDEEDDNYNPDHDLEGDGRPKKSAKTTATLSRRGCAVGAASGRDAFDDIAKATEAKRKAKAAKTFEELNASSHRMQAFVGPSEAGIRSSHKGRPILVSVSSQKRKRFDPDAYWMQALGFVAPEKRVATPQLVNQILADASRDRVQNYDSTDAQAPLPEPATGMGVHAPQADAGQPSKEIDTAPPAQPAQCYDSIMEDSRPAADTVAVEAASAAMKNIATGVHAADGARRANTVQIVEKRNFAGQEVEIARELEAGSKAAEAAQQRVKAAANKSGLDAALANMAGPKKANLIDKSADDWQGYKSQNVEVKDELNDYNKSSDKYLEKQAFLKRTEFNEYEKDRDSRLQSDIRTRARV